MSAHAGLDAADAVVAVSVLARHGARYPNSSELAAFASDSGVRTQWHAGATALYTSDANLSDVGRAQMETLGRFLGKAYAPLVDGEVKWESSPAERCEESGWLVLRGFAAETKGTIPHTPSDDGKRNVTFKAWARPGTPYFATVLALKRGEHAAHAERALTRRRALESMYLDLNEDHAAVPDAQLLYWSCYLHCLAEAEAYDCAVLPGTTICPATSGRYALRVQLDWAQFSECERDARATWAARFLDVGEHRGFVGGHLKHKMFEKTNKVALYSGHDYSLLSLLAALGVSDYPKPALGFGAYIIVEHLANGATRVLLNPAPFRDAQNRCTETVDTSRVREIAVRDIELIEPPADDAALAALGST